jgi:hypothetical protein
MSRARHEATVSYQPATDAQPPHPARVPVNQRGMVMMMVLLMLGVLSLLASAAAVRTAMDLREGGAERLTRASYRLGEAGTLGVLTLASQMQGGFSDYIAAKTDKSLSMSDMGDGLLALTGTDNSFGRELGGIGAVGFTTLVQDSDAASAAGYDVGRYCFRTYRMITTSQLGSLAPTSVQQAMVSGQTRLQATMTVGPVPCGQ